MDALFLAKKVVTFFVEPLGLILTLGLVGLYYLYRSAYIKAKLFLSLALSLLMIFSYPPVGNFLIHQLESQYPQYDYQTNNVGYIHVLGGGHHENDNWPLSSKIGNASLKRTIEGVTIFKEINQSDLKLIFTGYAGPRNQISNAKMNASIAKIAGVNNQSLIINGSPKDTQEEAEFSKTIIGVKPFILVTSASHMPRAMKLFRKMNMSPIAAPTNFKNRKIELLSAPSIGSFKKSRIAIHEFLGIAWSSLISKN